MFNENSSFLYLNLRSQVQVAHLLLAMIYNQNRFSVENNPIKKSPNVLTKSRSYIFYSGGNYIKKKKKKVKMFP